jgi:hypothetical protein
VKEQTADGTRLGAPALDRSLQAALQRGLTPALFFALALLVTTGYGSGVQLNDGQAALHIDPIKFLGHLLHAWNPALALGFHTGFFVPYQTPYSWAYAAAQLLRVPQDVAQHAAVFFVYLGCLWSMYYCLRSVAPWLDEVARIAGSCAYLFNMYVALNSQAQVVWLLTYATLPAMVGVMARALRGELNLRRAALAIALLVLAGGGINPPLVAINVIVLAIFVAVTLVFDPAPGLTRKRALPVIVAASIATIAINLYWIVPFGDYFRSAWLNGVLSEAPSMHNAATSFANVLRGLGHWATFVSFAGRAYFPWAASYVSGLFGSLLWFVPIVALGSLALRRNQRPAALFFLVVTIVSIPLVVGYYRDDWGNAVTTPLYDQLYRNFPGFQMFRFSYKWVAGVEFGISGLYALGAAAIVTALQDHISKFGTAARAKWSWLVYAARALSIVMPILIFVPVLIEKMNYPAASLPAWQYRESALVGDDQRRRVALFPTQYLEQFDWGNPQFYVEDSLVDRPMIYGFLGSEPSAGTDRWVRRAYRATREGLPFATDMFRAMGVDTILQRDDFIPAIDFSSPGESRSNSTTLTHDLLHRVIGASPVRSYGPLRVYRVDGALPLFYGVTHPLMSTLPALSDAYLGDVAAMAKGRAQFDPPSRSADQFTAEMESLSPILPQSAAQIRDLAVNQALSRGILVNPPSAEASVLTRFEVKTYGVYEVFALEESLLYAAPAPQTLELDGTLLSPQRTGGAWTPYGSIELNPGSHWVSDLVVDPSLVVALVNVDDLRAWEERIAALTRALPRNLATASLVYASRANVTLPVSGRYRVRATAVIPFDSDGVVRAHLRPAYASVFPAGLADTLPYAFSSGVVGTSAIVMPPHWYGDASVYRWQRGDPSSWFLFTRSAHVRVFVSGRNAIRANASLRISRLQVAGTMAVAVNGARDQNVVLPGPPASEEQYDAIDRLEGPPPVAVGFSLDLDPGWNDVAFTFRPRNVERKDLGPGVISAAVAPDLAFTRIGERRSLSSPRSESRLRVLALTNPPDGLAGDPEIIGNFVTKANRGAWLAVALAHGDRIAYRLFPIGAEGAFDVSFLHAFPNGWNDASQRIVGIWLLAWETSAKFSDLDYGVHALPGRALGRTRLPGALPVLIDGRLVGAVPILLGRGRHTVASAKRQVRIGLLTFEPDSLPQTRAFGLKWQRHSPTAIDVTAARISSPFLLVFGESYHPQWSATLAGEVLPHVIVNGVANGWIVPSLPDGGRIVLTFAGEKYYVISAAISAVALLIMIVLASFPDLRPVRTADR